jgi:hypothetical protein
MKKYSEYLKYLEDLNLIKLEKNVLNKDYYDNLYANSNKGYTIIITLDQACGLRADYNPKKGLIEPWLTNGMEKEKEIFLPKEFSKLIDDR